MLQASGLGKRFKLYTRPADRAVEWATWGRIRCHQIFWALRNVDLELRSGESLAVVGPNGAGKTTLLRLLAGTLVPSEGDCRRAGRVASLFALGAGLNPVLTGRENAERAASLLGSSLSESDRDYIRAFADLGPFFDRPIAEYSAGMRARLAFATFTAMKADVILLDEALRAGDPAFRERCRKRLRDLLDAGVAAVMTSHNFAILEESCTRGLVLEAGQVRFEGPVREALRIARGTSVG